MSPYLAYTTLNYIVYVGTECVEPQ